MAVPVSTCKNNIDFLSSSENQWERMFTKAENSTYKIEIRFKIYQTMSYYWSYILWLQAQESLSREFYSFLHASDHAHFRLHPLGSVFLHFLSNGPHFFLKFNLETKKSNSQSAIWKAYISNRLKSTLKSTLNLKFNNLLLTIVKTNIIPICINLSS